MNAEADAVAKRYLGFCIHNPEVVISQHLGGTHWSVWCDGRNIVRDIDRNITRYIHGSRLIKHVQDKKGWSKVEVDSVDWETMERVSNTNTTSETLWRMKVASGFVPTANRMTMTKHWDSDICPRCNSHSENLEHLLTCGSAEAVKIRERDIVEFHQTLIARDTDPCIISTVIDTLRSRTSGRFQDHIPAEAGSLICMAAQEQDALGRLSVFQGYQSKTWAKAQEAYWDSLPSSRRKSVRQWACMFLRQWYKFMRHQWDQRNDFVHRKNKTDMKNKEEAKVTASALALHSEETAGLRPADRHLISDISRDELEKLDVKRKAQWVDNVTSARKKLKQIDTEEMVRMRMFFRNWQRGGQS